MVHLHQLYQRVLTDSEGYRCRIIFQKSNIIQILQALHFNISGIMLVLYNCFCPKAGIITKIKKARIEENRKLTKFDHFIFFFQIF